MRKICGGCGKIIESGIIWDSSFVCYDCINEEGKSNEKDTK